MKLLNIKRFVFENLHSVCEQEIKNTKSHFYFVTGKISEREISKLMYRHILNCEDLVDFTSLFLDNNKDKEEIPIDEFSLVYLKNKSELVAKYKDELTEHNISTDIH